LLGTEAPETPEAILIDPGHIDMALIDQIEDSGYSLRAVLITHEHKHHYRGLRTLKQIYDVDIYAVNQTIAGHKVCVVQDGNTIDIGPFHIKVISIPGHSSDSVIYRIDHLLFTGDVLSAGLVGRTDSTYSDATQMITLRNKIFTLPGNYILLPGHGPPSSLKAEQAFNLGIQSYEQFKPTQSRWIVDM
jgi:glyoxylase-like metal-dependent hydrolase (beta-lactamase superfamily II)